MREMTGFSSLETAPREERHSWKSALAGAVRDPDELVDILGLPATLRAAARSTARLFPLVVPRDFIARMRPGDPGDPLLRQVLPLAEEEAPRPGFGADPVDDREATVLPGLLRKYSGRALLMAAPACAIHCRYCFRRHFPYEDVPRGVPAWDDALAALASDSGIREVILSGGDPLILDDGTLERLVGRLAAIEHLERLRVHTRLPVVLPERVTGHLVAWLRGTRLTPVVVVHVNHPNELEGSCPRALGRLVDAGIPVLNQAVLLRGVNDSAETLCHLSERLVSLRVMPYYLHQLDRVEGAAHFEVDEQRGLEILAELERHLPGYAVPRYVREVPGAPGKVPVAACLQAHTSSPLDAIRAPEARQ